MVFVPAWPQRAVEKLSTAAVRVAASALLFNSGKQNEFAAYWV